MLKKEENVASSPPISFIIHRILSYLEEQNEVVRMSVVEKHITFQIRNIQQYSSFHLDMRSDKNLIRLLQASNRIELDFVNGFIRYINPYKDVKSVETLLSAIVRASSLGVDSSSVGTRPLTYGLKVDRDLLNSHANIKDFIEQLLTQKKVRAIRPAYVKGARVRCLMAEKEGSTKNNNISCSLYSTDKCIECQSNYYGVYLYALGNEVCENQRNIVDDDVKLIWTGTKLPALETILKETNDPYLQYKWIQPSVEEKKRLIKLKRKQRRQQLQVVKSSARLRKIHNSHIFTADEIRMEI